MNRFNGLKALVVCSILITNIPYYNTIVADDDIQIIQNQSTIADELFIDETFTTLKDDVNQSKIDELKKQAQSIQDGGLLTLTMTRLTQAEQLLQEFIFTGFNNRQFATLRVYNDDTSRAFFHLNAGQPHYLIDDIYLSIDVLNLNKEVVFQEEIIGKQNCENKVIPFEIKEGYEVKIYKYEPSRFTTNHNNELKHDDVNPYHYVMKDGKLVRYHQASRYLTLKNNQHKTYLQMKFDYNANKIYFESFNEMASESLTISVYDLNNKLVEQIQTKEKEMVVLTTQEIVFLNGYKIKVEGLTNSISLYDDYNEIDQSLTLDATQNTFVLNSGELYVEFNETNEMKQVYKDAFIQMIGTENIEKFKNESIKQQQFIDYFLNDYEAMKQYLLANNASDLRNNPMDHFGYSNVSFNVENELKALRIYSDIYHTYKDCMNGMNIKIAIAVSKEFANGVASWMQNEDIDPLKRYEIYVQSYANNMLMNDFATYSVSTLRNVVSCSLTHEDFLWLRNFIETNHKDMLTSDKIVKGHSLLAYNEKNPVTNESVHGSNFYGENPDISSVLKYGGVCGAMSKFSSLLAQCYGIAAFAVSQPGHCAYEYIGSDHQYHLGYDVYGWEKSGNYNSTLPYLKIHLYYQQHNERYEESEYYRYLAYVSTDKFTKAKHLTTSLMIEPLNYQAMSDYLKITVHDEYEYSRFCSYISDSLKDYPKIADDLCGTSIKESTKAVYTNKGLLQENITLQTIHTLQKRLDGLMEGYYKQSYQNILDKAKSQIQQFEADGYAHKEVVLINAYNDGSHRVTYSLTAGQPHSSFATVYIQITMIDENGNTILNDALIGNQNYEAKKEQFLLKEGSIIKISVTELFRYHTSDDTNLKTDQKTYTYVKENGIFKLK